MRTIRIKRRNIRFFLQVLLVVVLAIDSAGSLFGDTGGDKKVVTFPGPYLEAAIREEIGKPTGDIYRSDLARLTMFSVVEKEISNLTGLQYAVNLISLDLWGNQITDISPLSGLTELISLRLRGNQISDISPLLKNLGLSEEGGIDLRENPLGERSLNIYIPLLKARGVQILSE